MVPSLPHHVAGASMRCHTPCGKRMNAVSYAMRTHACGLFHTDLGMPCARMHAACSTPIWVCAIVHVHAADACVRFVAPSREHSRSSAHACVMCATPHATRACPLSPAHTHTRAHVLHADPQGQDGRRPRRRESRARRCRVLHVGGVARRLVVPSSLQHAGLHSAGAGPGKVGRRDPVVCVRGESMGLEGECFCCCIRLVWVRQAALLAYGCSPSERGGSERT